MVPRSMGIKTFGSILLMSLVSMVLACQIPLAEIDPTGENSYQELFWEDLAVQGYMGGSILYNSQFEPAGHLQKNAQVAFRLGFVQEELDPVEGIPSYNDITEKTIFGDLFINQVNMEGITFDYNLFDANRTKFISSSATIALGQTYDLNNDGISDLLYREADATRTGAETLRYLEFTSNQSTLTTSMFSVLTSSYGIKNYPGSIIGINPNGNYILSAQGLNSQSRALTTNALEPGDYVLDGLTGEYKKVEHFDPQSRAIDFEEAQTTIDGAVDTAIDAGEDLYESSPLGEILPIASVQSTIDNIEEIEDGIDGVDVEDLESQIPTEGAGSFDEYKAQRSAILAAFKPYKVLSSWSPGFDTKLLTQLGMDPGALSVKLGVLFTASINWSSAKTSVRVATLVDTGAIELRLNKNIITELIKPIDLSVTVPAFTIGPFGLNIGGFLNAGLRLKAGVNSGDSIGFEGGLTGLYGGGMTGQVKWSVIPPKFSASFKNVVLNKTASFAKALISGSPDAAAYVSLEPWLGFGLTAETSPKWFKARVGPEISLENRVDVTLPKLRRVEAKGKILLHAKLLSSITANIKVGPLPRFYKKWAWDTPKVTSTLAKWDIFTIDF